MRAMKTRLSYTPPFVYGNYSRIGLKGFVADKRILIRLQLCCECIRRMSFLIQLKQVKTVFTVEWTEGLIEELNNIPQEFGVTVVLTGYSKTETFSRK